MLDETGNFTVERYKEALLAVQDEMKGYDYEILRFQYTAPERTITSKELAFHLGYSNFSTSNRLYGGLGSKLASYLDPKNTSPRIIYKGSGKVALFGYLSYFDHNQNGEVIWIMHPELAQALEQLYIVNKFDSSPPEEVFSDMKYSEGMVRQVTVNAYERNSQARKKCIEYYGAICSVCDFDFAKTYGKVGTGYIHVHHLKPLSEVAEGYEVNPIEHLRPVCPNCHAVIHLKTRRIPLRK